MNTVASRLIWARRDRQGLSLRDFLMASQDSREAHSLPDELILAFESGDQIPTRNQAFALSNIYGPLATWILTGEGPIDL